MDTIVEEILSAQTLLIASLSYALGAVPFGLILTKWFAKRDIRQIGSGNIGATNAVRAAGPWVGGLTLVLDVGKGYLPAAVAFSLGSSLDVAAVCGFCAFLGHCFPVWLRFSGGKGVATGLGVIAALSLWVALFALIGFALAYFWLKQVGAGSIMGAVVAAVASFVMPWTLLPKVILFVMAVIILAKHQENIRRLLMREGI